MIDLNKTYNNTSKKESDHLKVEIVFLLMLVAVICIIALILLSPPDVSQIPAVVKPKS